MAYTINIVPTQRRPLQLTSLRESLAACHEAAGAVVRHRLVEPGLVGELYTPSAA